ncbi:MAG: DegT/DnrJ/EryC1/StrS family aminotransferase [Acidimicrobiia bacterium]|nr:DegT/DnrJ/EryC1/StrS family aminotransferase [Acidimicrobiia bacterium]
MTTERRIAIAAPCIGDEEWEAVREPLTSGWLTQGPKVAAFEAAFSDRHQVAHALAVTSCTTGLHLALAALGIGDGDEVIVPAFTWVATANAVLYCGATPVFVDVDTDTYNLDPAQLERALTARTRAVIPVHLFGLCADMDAIRDAVPDDVALVEDAACAVGATYKGRPAGGLGRVASFSFHPRKIITTGEGGMVTTDDPELYAAATMLRNHGAAVSEEERHGGPQPYLLPDFEVMGFNYRMTDLQGAVGLVQLGRLDALLEGRRRLASVYGESLGEIGWLQAPVVSGDYGHSWQSYVCLVAADAPLPRNDLMERLHARGVSTRPGTHAVTELGFYRKRFPQPLGACARAAELEHRTLALPLHNGMTEDDVAFVVDSLRAASR